MSDSLARNNLLPLCTIHLFFWEPKILIASVFHQHDSHPSIHPCFALMPLSHPNPHPCFQKTSPRLRRRRKNTLLSPTLPLLLPRSLTIPKRKPARPLIRARSLAHPPHIPAKQQRPRAKAEQHAIPNQAGGESETPPAHQLRVQVESRDGLESDCDSGRRFS
jgi:hypothetical protein